MASSNFESKEIWGTDSDPEFAEIVALPADQIVQRTKMLQNNMRAIKSDSNSIDQQVRELNERIKDNTEKIKVIKQLPYLVANVVEVRSPNALVHLLLNGVRDAIFMLLNI